MSYRTDYFLSVDTLSDELVKQMAEMVHAFDGGGVFEDISDGEWAGYDLRWYAQELDMFRLSKQFPDNMFTLSGYGENRDDIWIEYWKDGAVQTCTMMFPPYDEAKMIPYTLVDGRLVLSHPDDEVDLSLNLEKEDEDLL